MKCVTDDSGSVGMSGFHGEYEVTCEGETACFTLDKKEEHITLTVK